MAKVEQVLQQIDGGARPVRRASSSARMFSNFIETTSIRINGVDPAAEAATTPLLPGRIVEGRKEGPLVKPRARS